MDTFLIWDFCRMWIDLGYDSGVAQEGLIVKNSNAF